MTIDARIAALGLTLPKAAAPIAAYVPAVEIGGFLYISGQISFAEDGSILTGTLGGSGDGARDLEFGAAAAKRCGLMLVAQMQAALGSLERVERIVKLGAFIACTAGFTQQPEVANGASDLMVAIFGEAGKHSRSAVGVPVLPRGAVVEIDAVVAVRPA